MENKHLEPDEIIEYFHKKTALKGEFAAISVIKPVSQIDVSARAIIANYALLVNGGAAK